MAESALVKSIFTLIQGVGNPEPNWYADATLIQIRQDHMRIITGAFLAVALSVFSTSSWAFMERYVEGVHYVKVKDATPKPGTVTEFFSFGCPHCSHLEPAVEAWLKTKPAKVKFDRVPATWNKKFQVLAQLYYTLESLNQLESSMAAVFDYIHKQGKHIHSAGAAQDFLVSLGMDRAAVKQAWNAEEIDDKLRAAAAAYARNQIRGVPAFLVNGQYQTSVSMAGSETELFKVVEFLMNK